MLEGRLEINPQLPHFEDTFTTAFNPFVDPAPPKVVRETESYGGLPPDWSYKWEGKSSASRTENGFLSPVGSGSEIYTNLYYQDIDEPIVPPLLDLADRCVLVRRGALRALDLESVEWDNWSHTWGRSFMMGDISIDYGVPFTRVLEVYDTYGPNPDPFDLWIGLFGSADAVLHQMSFQHQVTLRNWANISDVDLAANINAGNSDGSGRGTLMFGGLSPGDNLLMIEHLMYIISSKSILVQTEEGWTIVGVDDNPPFAGLAALGSYKLSAGAYLEYYHSRNRTSAFFDLSNTSGITPLGKYSAAWQDNPLVGPTITLDVPDLTLDFAAKGPLIYGDYYRPPLFMGTMELAGGGGAGEYGFLTAISSILPVDWMQGGFAMINGGWKIDRRGIG